MPDYRDCVDFKFKKSDIALDKSEDAEKLKALWQDVYDAQYPAVVDYCKAHNIMELKYWEAFNFINMEKASILWSIKIMGILTIVLFLL